MLMCADCQAARGHGSGPYPVRTRGEMQAGLDLMPTWALQQKAAANRQVIAIMRQRLAAGEEVARMYQEPGLAGWSARQRSPRSWSRSGSERERTAQDHDRMGWETRTPVRCPQGTLVVARYAR